MRANWHTGLPQAWPSSRIIFSCQPCGILWLARAELWQSAVFEKNFSFPSSWALAYLSLFRVSSLTFPHAHSYSYYKHSSSNISWSFFLFYSAKSAFSRKSLWSLLIDHIAPPLSVAFSLSSFFLSQPLDHGGVEIIHLSTNIYWVSSMSQGIF